MISLYNDKPTSPSPTAGPKTAPIRLFGESPTPAPKSSGSAPIRLYNDPQSPVPPSTPAFAGKGYGPAAETDPASGEPFATVPMKIPKTFMSPETSVAVVDKTRVAPSFDPTVPQKIDPATLHNPRMKGDVSTALRKSLGATAFEELDHIMPLELGGSNDTTNLRREEAQNPDKPYSPGSNPTPTDPVENELAKQVHNGDKTGISLEDAWRAMAKAKGITLPEDKALNGPISQFLLEHGGILKGLSGIQDLITGTATKAKDAFTSVLHSIEDSVASHLSGVPTSSEDTSGAFRVHMSDQEISKATPEAPPAAGPADPLSAITGLPKAVIQAATRSALSYGLSLAHQDEPIQPGSIPNSKLSPEQQIALYGTEPIAPIASQYDISKAKTGDLKSLGTVGGAALGLGVNVQGLDPGLLGEDFIAQLAKETNPEKIISLLAKKGIDEDTAKMIAPSLVEAKTTNAVTSILKEASQSTPAAAVRSGLVPLSTTEAIDRIKNSKNPEEIMAILRQMKGINPDDIPIVAAKLKTLVPDTEKLKNLVETSVSLNRGVEGVNAEQGIFPKDFESGTRSPQLPDENPLRPSYLEGSPEERRFLQRAGTTRSAILPQSTEFESDAKEAFAHTVPSSDLPVKSKVNIIDYLRTPDAVLEKMGMRSQMNTLRTSFEAYKSDLTKQFTYLRSLAAKVPGPESSKNIFRFLDGQNVSLSTAEQEVANTIKKYLADWADRLDLPRNSRIGNYITHIFEQGSVEKEFDPELAKIIDEKVPGSVYDPFLQKRIGAAGYKEDVWQALDAYVKRATRKVNMDPALLQLKNASEELDLESMKYIKRYVDNVNMRPAEIDNLIDNAIKQSPLGYKFGQRPTAAITKTWRNMIYRSTLGLNVGSAVKNLMQGTNTYAKLGTRYTLQGYFDLMRFGTRELYDNAVLGQDLIQDQHMGLLKKVGEKVDTTMFSLFELAEKINRGSAYYGAKAQGLSTGMDPAKAIEYAKRIVRDTQFAFSDIDTPVALQGDLMKTLAQLQTFNIKQAEFLGSMVKNKEYAGIIRWTASSLALVSTIGKVFGMGVSDLIPTFRLGGGPLGNVIQAFTDYFSSNSQKHAQGVTELKKIPFLLIPGGMQLFKTIQGTGTVLEGKSTTAAGKTRYTVDRTPLNLVRGALFGTQGLPDAQDYYSNLGKKSSSSKK